MTMIRNGYISQMCKTMKEYHKETIRLGLTCLYMTDLSIKESLNKQELYMSFFYCLQRRWLLRQLPHIITFQWGKKCDSLLDPPDNPDVEEGGAS